MPQKLNVAIAVIGIDIGKNSFHVVGYKRGAIALRQKWSRGQVEARLANMPPCLIGMEACVGAHHLSRKLKVLGHDARLMPAKIRPSLFEGTEERLPRCRGDCRGRTAANKEVRGYEDADQLDVQALHRVRERFVSQRTGIINQIRAFMLERGIAVRQGLRFLRAELPGILASRTAVLSPRMVRVTGLVVEPQRERAEAAAREAVERLKRAAAASEAIGHDTPGSRLKAGRQQVHRRMAEPWTDLLNWKRS